jgi:Protein of unknown function (DUF4238)
MARDHFIPRTYLRSFTPEYLKGTPGGELITYAVHRDRYKKVSLNRHIGFEPDLYNAHPIDKQWQEHERRWPTTLAALKQRSTAVDILEELFTFATIQFVRVPQFMELIARQLAVANRRTVETEWEGKPLRGVILDNPSVDNVLDNIAARMPELRNTVGREYKWTCCHNSTSELFLTSDNPFAYRGDSDDFAFPLSLDIAVWGETSESESHIFNHSNGTSELVRKINRRTVKNAERLVFSHQMSNDLRRFIKRHHTPLNLDPMAHGRTWVRE